MMKKHLNNKGYMLIEIILASVIAMTVAYFIMDLTIKLKNKNDDLLVKTLVYTDQAIIYNKIMSRITEIEQNPDLDLSCNEIKIKQETDEKKITIDDFKYIVSDYATVGDISCGEKIENDSGKNIGLKVNW